MYLVLRVAMRSDAMHGEGKTTVKIPCFAIGITHLILIGLSLYERIWELVELAEPFHLQDHTVVLLSNVTQVLSVFLLIFGSITGKSNYIIPWLICTAPLFSFATIYAVLYITQEEPSQILFNFMVVGIIWSTWYIVIKFHLENRIRTR